MMKLLTRKLLASFFAVLILISIQTTIFVQTQFCEIRVINNSTGKTIFEDVSGASKEFAKTLISSNTNLANENNNSEFGKTVPNSRVQVKSSGIYIISQTDINIPLLIKCNLKEEYLNNYNLEIINNIRGRGS